MIPRALFLALGIAVFAVSALAEGAIDRNLTPADKVRLEKYGEVRKAALAEAQAGGAPEDLKTLEEVLAKPFVSFEGFDLTGDWQCRTIKVGGFVRLIVYGWFKCKVTNAGQGWVLEKVSGSQRTQGHFLYESDKRLIYFGTFFVEGDEPKPYGSGLESDQVGYAFLAGPKEWRIELPSPYYESNLDIMQFKR